MGQVVVDARKTRFWPRPARENERAAETTTIFLSFQVLGASWRRVSSAGTVLYEAMFLPAMASLSLVLSLVLPLQIWNKRETNEN